MTEKHCLILTQVTSLCQLVAYWESEGTEGSRHTGTQGFLSSSPSSLSRRAKAQRVGGMSRSDVKNVELMPCFYCSGKDENTFAYKLQKMKCVILMIPHMS